MSNPYTGQTALQSVRAGRDHPLHDKFILDEPDTLRELADGYGCNGPMGFSG